jgi:uncharacterized protein (DUF488 family)
MEQPVFTIGHSNHPQQDFLSLLLRHEITAVCDVRSKPYSRLNPQFNREALRQTLTANGIAYVFLGKELGAQSEDRSNYENGKVQYERLAKTELFQQGIQRLREGMKDYRVAITCAEKEPLECHRTILVARQLASLGIDIRHIHATGELESHADALDRLRRLLRLPEADLFREYNEILADAYRRQEERIAYESTSAAAAGARV